MPCALTDLLCHSPQAAHGSPQTPGPPLLGKGLWLALRKRSYRKPSLLPSGSAVWGQKPRWHPRSPCLCRPTNIHSPSQSCQFCFQMPPDADTCPQLCWSQQPEPAPWAGFAGDPWPSAPLFRATPTPAHTRPPPWPPAWALPAMLPQGLCTRHSLFWNLPLPTSLMALYLSSHKCKQKERLP